MLVLFETPAGYAVFKVNLFYIFEYTVNSNILFIAVRWKETSADWQSFPRFSDTWRCKQSVSNHYTTVIFFSAGLIIIASLG